MTRLSSSDEIVTAVTPQGLRLVCDWRRHSSVEYVAVMIDAGSRDDPPDREGLAHLVEHTIFKGTSRRRSSTIINTMERVGGELNAYTTKELTAVYSVFPAGYARRAAALIAELITDSQFPEAELEKEREVVIDEINSYLDIPAENIYDEFEDLAFAGTPLGHNILGTEASVRAMTSADCRSHIDRLYHAKSVVVAYSGPLTPNKAMRMLETTFGILPAKPCNVERRPSSVSPAFIREQKVDLHQANVVIGAQAPSLYDSDRFATLLMVNMLGGPGMNSRLNMALREKRGLVYSVEAWVNMYADTGLAAIYFGCDKEDVARCRRLVEREIHRLLDQPLSERSIQNAKRQYIGQTLVGADNRESFLLSLARQMLHYGRVSTRERQVETIYAITPEQLQRAVAQLASPSILIMQ